MKKASLSAQFIYNCVLSQSTQTRITPIGRIRLKLLGKIFNYLKNYNLLVEAQIGKYRLRVPFTHQLPFILKSYPFYSTNLGRIARLVFNKYPDLKLIDVGANVGDSIALLRSEAMFPILCVEGDDQFFSILEQNADQFKDVYLLKTYLGESDVTLNAISVEEGGTAHLQELTSNSNLLQIRKLSSVLSSQLLFSKAKMLKIDTDGFDYKILLGSANYIKSAHPVLFFEFDPFLLKQQQDDALSIFEFLTENGYRNLLIYENQGELSITADLSNTRLLEDITYYYSGRKSLKYCDICAFHMEDNDLFETVRQSEIQFFAQART